jgi:hypothetical protein
MSSGVSPGPVSANPYPASAAGHSCANALVSTLPKTHRILLIDERNYSYFPNAALRAAVVPGWEKRMIVPLTQDNIFPGGVHHRLIVPNRVMELRRDSVILEWEFEGSREVPFFVSRVLQLIVDELIR